MIKNTTEFIVGQRVIFHKLLSGKYNGRYENGTFFPLKAIIIKKTNRRGAKQYLVQTEYKKYYAAAGNLRLDE